MADSEATLGDLAFVIMPNPDWGKVNRTADEAENIYADANTQLPVRTSELRKMTFQAKFTGASKDDLIAQEAALRLELRKRDNLLTVKPRNATNSVTWRVLLCPVPISPFDYTWDHQAVGITTITLICEPYGYSSDVAVYAAEPLTSPALAPLTGFVGDGDPTLAMTIARGWTGEDGIETVICALAKGTSISEYFYEAEDADVQSPWTVDNTLTSVSGGEVVKLASASSTAWNVLADATGALLPEGRYRVMVRTRCSSGGGEDSCHIAMRKTHSTTRDPKTRRLLTNLWVWHDLGEYVNYGGNPLYLYGRAAAGSLYIDCLLMVPVDAGYVRYDDTDGLTDSWTMGWLYDHFYGTVADPTLAANAAGRMIGHGVKMPIQPDDPEYSLLVLVEPKGNDPAPAFGLSLSYKPRWEQWR